jgi:hypothetical protein
MKLHAPERDMPAATTAPGYPSAEAQPAHSPEPSRLRRLLSAVGPGLITGAADDDPSGIAPTSRPALSSVMVSSERHSSCSPS